LITKQARFIADRHVLFSIRVIEATVSELLEEGDTVTGISYKLKSGVTQVNFNLDPDVILSHSYRL